jgi:hypothetical protein
MSVIAPVADPHTEQSLFGRIVHQPRYRLMLIAMIGVVSMSLGRILSGNDDLTSSGTIGVALRTAAPIALAGLAGL